MKSVVWCERRDCSYRHKLGYCSLRSVRLRVIPDEPSVICASYQDEEDIPDGDTDWHVGREDGR